MNDIQHNNSTIMHNVCVLNVIILNVVAPISQFLMLVVQGRYTTNGYAQDLPGEILI
jgi:hypothetical protein